MPNPKSQRNLNKLMQRKAFLLSLTGNMLGGYNDDGSHFQGKYILMGEGVIRRNHFNVL